MKIKPEDREKAVVSSNPPQMPMVLDAMAIQEILGASYFYHKCITKIIRAGVMQKAE